MNIVDNQRLRCMSELGAHHGVFVHSMVTSLLDLHPIFEPQEQHIDDVFCESLYAIVSHV